MLRTFGHSLLVVALASGAALAQTPPAATPPATKPAPTRPAPPPNAPHLEGDYGGVAPGAPTAKPRRAPPKGTLTWVGFEAKDGGAQLFFQSVAPFVVTQRMEGTALVVHLSLTRMGAQTWRRIDTRFFDNPLAAVVARAVGARRATKQLPARGRGIDVRVTFKNPRDAREGSVRTATEADGMHYAYVTFPEGTGEPAGTTTTPAAAEPEQ